MDPLLELHAAIDEDDIVRAERALDAGADPGAANEWGYEPLDWAAHLGACGVAALLVDRGVGPLTLVAAAGAGFEDELRAMLDSGDYAARRPSPGPPDEHWPQDTAYQQGDVLGDALFAAARNGHLAVVRLLVEHGADPGARGVFGAPGLHWAALHGHLQVARYLVEQGADPLLQDPHFEADASAWAAEGGHGELAAELAS